MERLAVWDKSYENLATVLRLDTRCKVQQLHINESAVKCFSNKEVLTEKIRYLHLDFLLFTYLLLTYFLTYLLHGAESFLRRSLVHR